MAETVNLSEAARRLRISRPTLKKRLSKRWLKGAVKRGRDWQIPVSEIDRVITDNGAALVGKELYAQMVAISALTEYSRPALKNLEAAARAFVAQLDTGKPATRDYVSPLRDAIKAYDDSLTMSKVVEAIRLRAPHKPSPGSE